MKEKVLVVDDEKKYRDLISLFLQSEDLHVIQAASGKEALRLFRQEHPDLVILDIMLPDIDGFDVCKEIRKVSEVPILFLTALNDEDYHIIGYRAGADDFIPKPFKSSVLALKIKRFLYRARKENDKAELDERGIVLDESAFTCTVDGIAAPLTQKEFFVLREFLQNKGRVLTRDYLLREIWGFEYDGDTRAVDTLITKLRKKLGASGSLIKTVINVGYKMEGNP